MEYDLEIYCADCTIEERGKPGLNKYYVAKFYSLSAAIEHYIKTKHMIQIGLEPLRDEE